MENSNQSNNNNNHASNNTEWWEQLHAKHCFIRAIELVEKNLGEHLLESYLAELVQLKFAIKQEIDGHLASDFSISNSTSTSNSNVVFSTSTFTSLKQKVVKTLGKKDKSIVPAEINWSKAGVYSEYRMCIRFWSAADWLIVYMVTHVGLDMRDGSNAKTCNGVTIDKMGHVGKYPPPKYKQMNIKIRHTDVELLHTCVHELIHWLCFPEFERILIENQNHKLSPEDYKKFAEIILLEGVTECFARYCLRGTPDLGLRSAYQYQYEYISAICDISMPKDFNKLCNAYFKGDAAECRELFDNGIAFRHMGASYLKSKLEIGQHDHSAPEVNEHNFIMLENGKAIPRFQVEGILAELHKAGVSDMFGAGRRMGIPAKVLAEFGFRGG